MGGYPTCLFNYQVRALNYFGGATLVFVHCHISISCLFVLVVRNTCVSDYKRCKPALNAAGVVVA